MSLRNHYKQTLRLGLPIAIGQVGVIIMGFADTMMVGRYATDALAAASFVNNVANFFAFLLMGYSYGLTPLISSLTGGGDRRQAGAMFKQGIAVNAVYGAIVLGVMFAFFTFIPLMGQPEELLPLIMPYYAVILLSMIPLLVFNAVRQFTDGTLDTASGMWVLLAGNALNILGNWLFIYGPGPFPELGLLGAGLATLLSRLFMAAAIIAVVMLRSRYTLYRDGWRGSRLGLLEMRRVNALSLPISVQMGLESGSFMMSTVMAGWLGAVPLASFQVILTVSLLGFLFYYSFGSGMSIRVASFIGSNDWKSVGEAARAGMHILLVLAAVACVGFAVLGRPLVFLFTHDPAVQAGALALIFPLIFYQLGDAMQICFSSALRATGHVVPLMWTAALSYLVVSLPVGYVLAFPLGLGTTGIFLGIAAALFTAAPLFRHFFMKEVAKHLKKA